MEEDFRALLTGSAAVTALVPASRIGWASAPQGAAYPLIVLRLIRQAEGLTLAGPDGLHVGRVQVDVYALTYREAALTARAVRNRLHGYRGGGFRLIEVATGPDARETGGNEPDRPYRVGMDCLTHWRDEE